MLFNLKSLSAGSKAGIMSWAGTAEFKPLLTLGPVTRDCSRDGDLGLKQASFSSSDVQAPEKCWQKVSQGMGTQTRSLGREISHSRTKDLGGGGGKGAALKPQSANCSIAFVCCIFSSVPGCSYKSKLAYLNQVPAENL